MMRKSMLTMMFSKLWFLNIFSETFFFYILFEIHSIPVNKINKNTFNTLPFAFTPLGLFRVCVPFSLFRSRLGDGGVVYIRPKVVVLAHRVRFVAVDTRLEEAVRARVPRGEPRLLDTGVEHGRIGSGRRRGFVFQDADWFGGCDTGPVAKLVFRVVARFG